MKKRPLLFYFIMLAVIAVILLIAYFTNLSYWLKISSSFVHGIGLLIAVIILVCSFNIFELPDAIKYKKKLKSINHFLIIIVSLPMMLSLLFPLYSNPKKIDSYEGDGNFYIKYLSVRGISSIVISYSGGIIKSENIVRSTSGIFADENVYIKNAGNKKLYVKIPSRHYYLNDEISQSEFYQYYIITNNSKEIISADRYNDFNGINEECVEKITDCKFPSIFKRKICIDPDWKDSFD